MVCELYGHTPIPVLCVEVWSSFWGVLSLGFQNKTQTYFLKFDLNDKYGRLVSYFSYKLLQQTLFFMLKYIFWTPACEYVAELMGLHKMSAILDG